MSRKLILGTTLFFALFQMLSFAQSKSEKEKQPAPRATNDASGAKPGALEDRVEKYLRNLYAWGPSFEVKVGAPKPSPAPDLLEVPITVSKEGRSDSAVVYLTRNGNFLLRGELSDMSADPFADVRSKLHVGKSPALGPEDARITLIEFADFECPSCRQLDLILRELLPRHPEIRFVFKHFPLTDLHPWAMTAALASQCALEQSPSAFWKLHDAIFDAQDVISASNAWDKLQDLGRQVGLDPDGYRACMANPDTEAQVKETIEEGHTVHVTATPTTFINGRRLIGPDKSLLEQYIAFLSQPKHNIAYKTN